MSGSAYELNTNASAGNAARTGFYDSSGWVVNFGSGSVATGAAAGSTAPFALVAVAAAVAWLVLSKRS